ncbi:DNA polymerase nu isoform X1 [Alosa alosa]|uniref:DNA polymerase nu isoform X1 n=1 Tax=Alosa alosa TaxID=278164 RepID=UPI0020153E57|nr:DNA polymerase nu isoform X1 [Alosa alosa]XP_048092748.1 DNA polymerase nu isoform X1 [Alosa alosa]
MEDQFSRLYAGPLSASAQRIVAALRAEYADRPGRSHSYSQRRPVNPYPSQSTWSQSQTQHNHSYSNRSWPRPYSSFPGTQEESDRPTLPASTTESGSSPTPLPAWMESAEREPGFPSCTQDRQSPVQAEFSLRLDSPQNEPSFHFHSQPAKHSSVLFPFPQTKPPFPLPSPQRGSPFSSISPLKEPPPTPLSIGRGQLGYSGAVSAFRGAVRRLKMPQSESQTDMVADHFQIQLESGSDQARQQMIPATHTRLKNRQDLRRMQHTRPETNQTGPGTLQMQPESHCEETRQRTRPDTHTGLDNHHQGNFCHTAAEIGQADPDNLQTKPEIHQAQGTKGTQGSEIHSNTRSDLTDLQKHDPSATSPLVTVPWIPSDRSKQRGWHLSVMPSREASERGEQAENVPSPADPAKKGEFGCLLVPSHMTTAEIESTQLDRHSAGPMREESSEMEVDLGHSSARVVEQEDGHLISTAPPPGSREATETVTEASERGGDLGSPSEESSIQAHGLYSRSNSVEETHIGGEDMAGTLARDHSSHLHDAQLEAESVPDTQLPSAQPETASVNGGLSAFESGENALALSSTCTLHRDNQHEREADDLLDQGDQRNCCEQNDQSGGYKEIAWFDGETCVTEPNPQGVLSRSSVPAAEESQPELKRQRKISLTEEGEERKARECRAVDPAGSEEHGQQRRLGVSSRVLQFRAPPAGRTPLQLSQPTSQARQHSSCVLQVLAGSSNRSCGPKRHLLTPTAKGALESPRMAPSPTPTLRAPPSTPTPWAPPTPIAERGTPTDSTPSQQPPLSSRRRPVRWEPPRSSQGERGGGVDPSAQAAAAPHCPGPPHPDTTQTSAQHRSTNPRPASSAPEPPLPQRLLQQSPVPGGCPATVRADPQEPSISNWHGHPRATNQKQAATGPERPRIGGSTEGVGAVTPVSAAKPKPSLALTSDPRVCDTGRLSAGERERVLEEMRTARALVLTLVLQDGSTQLDVEQKNSPSVCGILILLKRALDLSRPQPTEEEKLLFLRQEQRPVWVQHQTDQNHEQFTRELVVLVLSGQRQVVCYKAKDLLRTTLQHHTHTLSWKQMGVCEVLDPQIAAWLLDPSDSGACFQELLNKHCKPNTHSSATHNFTPALGPQKVTQLISGLNHLYKLMVELRSKLKTKGLWQLYSQMETQMIPVLAAMESHRIHVDRDALKKTSDMLGSKLKQLEQEAHQAAGQQFLVSSNNQLRLVLFEKLRLHERCENKKLPKTLLKQQQSTSEAVLLQLQDLHPLPKIILEHRQIHKLKSTFVDGILSCMNKTFISSTWNQTSAVSGRLSAKHPNFQALPKQPLQITKKQYVHGKEAELVTVHPRTMFIPRQGWTFLSADFCQVELRLLAHLSLDPELLKIFQNPEADVFTMLASQWKGIKEDSVSSEDREHAKRIVYSVVYGAGRERLSGILGVSAEQASRFQDSFLQTYREVQTFIQKTIQQCHSQGYVVSIMGRRRSLPHIHSADWATRNQAERQAVNFVVQGSAADLCKMAMIRIFSQVTSSASLTARLVAQIHDELLFEVEEYQLQEFAVLVKRTMESLQHIDSLGVHLTVPLKVVVSSGSSWGSMSELYLPCTSSSD